MLKLLLLLLIVGAPAETTTTAPPGTGETIPAPRTEVSPDGRTASVADGSATLTSTATTDLDPAGQRVTVTGQDYDEGKGIYVALCRIPARDEPPHPCGGGAATAGSTGASIWISSNPPTYGQGLAVPYGPGGSFSTELTLQPVLDASTDCRRVPCAIVTRNDHTRSTDRGQDVFLPVVFRGSQLPTTTTSTLPPERPAAGTSSGEGGATAGPIVAAAAVVLLGGGLAAGVRRAKRPR